MVVIDNGEKDKELVFAIALTLIKNIGPRVGFKLLKHFGSAEAVFSANLQSLMQVEGLSAKVVYELLRPKDFSVAEAHIAYAKHHGIKVLYILNEDYPKRLRNCEDAPIVLYYKGNANLNASKIVSVVGTREASDYGKLICNQFVEAFKESDTLIVSGLAYGIDVSAHQACLTHQINTVGVLGHGLDKIYPASHYNIARDMLMQGGLLTEFLPGTRANRENFPKRNRIIAGLCDALVVIEATIKGGALISAELANSYHREVFAFPGRSHDVLAAGCNFLIKSHKAALITSAKDLIYAMA